VQVKPEDRQAFLEASLENARRTIQEPGNLRFDVNQSADDPNRFLLYEVYRDESGMKAHKETAHYACWAAAVAPLMAAPRQGLKYSSHFPAEEPSWRARSY
jgi:quinol monooxygenase YgiN